MRERPKKKVIAQPYKEKGGGIKKSWRYDQVSLVFCLNNTCYNPPRPLPRCPPLLKSKKRMSHGTEFVSFTMGFGKGLALEQCLV